MIGGAADMVTLVVMSAELEKNVKRITKANLPEGERKRALALLFTQFAFTGGMVALSVKGLLPEMVGRGQDISIVRYGDKEFAIPQGQSMQGGAINESMLKLGDTPDAAATKAHLDTMGKIERQAGRGALRGRGAAAPGSERADHRRSAGKVTSGPSAGTLADLIEKTQIANAAAAAHGVKVQYRVKISAAGPDGGSQVQIVAEAPTKSVPGSDVATLQLFTNMTSGRAQQIAAKAAEMKKLDPGSSIEILPDGRLRINAQADVGPEMLAKMKPDELTALLQGTKKLAETGWSLDTLKKNEKGLYDALEGKVLKTGAYRLRIDAHKTEALKWAQDTLQLPTDLKDNLGVLLGSADEGQPEPLLRHPQRGLAVLRPAGHSRPLDGRPDRARGQAQDARGLHQPLLLRARHPAARARRLGEEAARGRRAGAALQLRDRPCNARGGHGVRERGSGRQRPQGGRDVHQARFLARGHRQGAARQRGRAEVRQHGHAHVPRAQAPQRDAEVRVGRRARQADHRDRGLPGRGSQDAHGATGREGQLQADARTASAPCTPSSGPRAR